MPLSSQSNFFFLVVFTWAGMGMEIWFCKGPTNFRIAVVTVEPTGQRFFCSQLLADDANEPLRWKITH